MNNKISNEVKIIYIDTARMPTEKAHGYQICKMCEEFASAGARVELWTPSRDNEIKADVFSYYGVKKNFIVKKLFSLNFLMIRKFSEKLEFWLRNCTFFIGLVFKKVDKEIVVYTRVSEIAFIFGLKGNFVVYECHSWPGKRNFLFKIFVMRAGVIVAVTNGLKNIFEQNGFESSRIIVAPDGVDLQKFNINMLKDDARKALGLPVNKMILGYTGSFKTMETDKGIADALRALKILKDDYFFVAVGGTQKDISFYAKMAVNLGVEKRVLFTERVALEKLAIYQKAFDVLLMYFPVTEHYSFYMSPLKMFEYMASRRPIIASDLPAVREILNKNNAVLIPPSNPEGLAEAVRKTLLDQGFCDSISERAFFDVQKYEWQKRAQSILIFAENQKKQK